MAEISRLTRAGLRRLVALHAEGRRGGLRPSLVAPVLAGPLPLAEIEHRFADYLLDGDGGPLEARGPAGEAWFAGSLLVRQIAPGSAVAIADDVAAIVAAPALLDGGRLGARAWAARFACRADLAIAAAVALLAPDAAIAAIVELAARRGPDEELLHLALLQAGCALAWRPELLDAGELAGLCETLLDQLDWRSPEPLLDQLAQVLGGLAAAAGPRATHVQGAVAARLGETRRRIAGRRSGASFLDEFRALDRARALPDEDYFMTLRDRHVAEACARVLGRSAAGLDRDGFIALQSTVLDGELGATLLPSFVDGLIAAAAIAPLTDLADHLLAAADEEPRLLGLHIAAQLPLDACADRALASLHDDRTQVRVRAIRAVALLEPDRAVPALALRLDDPDPEVCAAAARALVELGQRARVEARRMPGELAVGKTRERTAAARAALADPSPEVIAALLPLVSDDAAPADPGDSPLVAALASILRGTADGIRLAAEVVRELPGALPIVGLALAGDDTPSVALAPGLRRELAGVLDPMIEASGEPGMLALELLSRFSRGDAAMIERIATAGARSFGYAPQVLSSLASVRLRSERAAEILAPWLDSRDHLGATLLATAVAGVVVPVEHRLWAQVRELYGLGSIAAAAAHAALVNRVRIGGEA